MARDARISELLGDTILRIEGAHEDSTQITFYTHYNKYSMVHHQDCCEEVKVEEIHGDVQDLIGVPILLAEETCSIEAPVRESGTWTFYRFTTIKGSVQIRWLGTSNGYYSEKVHFEVSNLFH